VGVVSVAAHSHHSLQSHRQRPNPKTKHLPNNSVKAVPGCYTVFEEEGGVEGGRGIGAFVFFFVFLPCLSLVLY
jgi:hypothetical protein